MQTFLDDLAQARRSLRARPAFALAVVLTLALAIGANTAIFSAVNAVLLGSLPYRDAARLVAVTERRTDGSATPFSIPDFLDVRAATGTLDDMAALFQWSANVTGGAAERLQGIRASGNFFAMLGVTAARGAVFGPEDARARVAVVSDALWRRRFGADPGIVGRDIVLNGEGYTVIGVLPASFVFPIREADLIAPFSFDTDPRRALRSSGFLRVLARMKPTATVDQVRADLDPTMARLAREYPADTAGRIGVTVTSWHDAIVGNTRSLLSLLQGAVVLMLLVACANLSNLMLASSVKRAREFGLRAALGANRGRIVRHLLIESALLAAAGAAVGVALAAGFASALQTFVPVELARAGAHAAVDRRVLAFTLLLTIAAVMAFALAPAWQLARGLAGADGLAGGRGVAGAPTRSTRRLLVGVEMAFAAALVILVGLLVRSFERLQAVDPGFDADRVLTVRVSLPRARYPRRADVLAFADRLMPKLASLPGVDLVATANVVPLNNYLATANFWIADRPKPPADQIPEAHYRTVSPGYFAALRIPIRAGRAFSDRDTTTSEPVAIVNASLVQRIFGGRSPLDQHLVLEDDEARARTVRIVGVAGDVKHFGLDADTTIDVLVPLTQMPEGVVQWVTNNMYWIVRSSVDPLSLQTATRRALQEVDADVPASNFRTMAGMLDAAVAPRRFNLRLIALFGIAALWLASAGVFAVTAHTVGERTRELGIRAALGAPRHRVVGLIVFDMLPSIAGGLVAGAVIARIVARLTSATLFGVGPTDPLTYSTASLALAVAGTLAAYWPARRARRVDPIVALRSDAL